MQMNPRKDQPDSAGETQGGQEQRTQGKRWVDEGGVRKPSEKEKCTIKTCLIKHHSPNSNDPKKDSLETRTSDKETDA